MSRITRILILLVFLLAGWKERLEAQAIEAAPGLPNPPWLQRWSPLRSGYDLTRQFPTLTQTPLSISGSPRLGLFHTGGNPAGLPQELHEARSDLAGTLGSDGGSYRRPLDPEGRTMRAIRASGWAPMSARSALIGDVVLDRQGLKPGSATDQFESHGSSPFLTIDTSSSDTRRIGVRLTGAAGWLLGPWSVGTAAGYEIRESQTLESPFVRRIRQSTPGVSLGITRALGTVRFGLHGQYRNRAETIQLSERTAQGMAIELQGNRDVTAFDIDFGYSRRIEERAGSVVLGATRQGEHLTWAGYLDIGRLTEHRTAEQRNDPLRDRWSANGWGAGLDLEARIWARGRTRLQIRYTQLNGEGLAAFDSTGTPFLANESQLEASIALVRAPSERSWFGSLTSMVRLERRTRDTAADSLLTRITGKTLGIAGEIGTAAGERFNIALMGSAGIYAADSRFPDPSDRGRAYREFIAPEIAFHAHDALLYSVGGTLTWQARPKTRFWLMGRRETVTSKGDSIPLAPEGARTMLRLLAGITLTQAGKL